jgi:hypothetical protein
MAWRNKHTISLAVCALALAAGLTVRPAMAYFTDYTEASGAVKISVADPNATIDEKVSDMTKKIKITNNGAEPCFVRVKAIAADKYTLTRGENSNENWQYNEEDEYYYYNQPLAVSDTTGELNIKIGWNGTEDTEDFNVVIIQEATKVLYKENGEPYADWTRKISTDQNSQEGGQ